MMGVCGRRCAQPLALAPLSACCSQLRLGPQEAHKLPPCLHLAPVEEAERSRRDCAHGDEGVPPTPRRPTPAPFPADVGPVRRPGSHEASGVGASARGTKNGARGPDGRPLASRYAQEGCLLYCCSNKVEFVKQMPPFNEWGLRPVGLEGLRESLILVPPCLSSPQRSPQKQVQVGEHRRTPAKWPPRKRRRSWPPRWRLLGLG